MARSPIRSFRLLTQRLRRSRILERVAVEVLVAIVKVVRALPSRWVLALADVAGAINSVIDRRGRAAALQNLEVAFGNTYSRRERLRIHRSSYKLQMRAVLLLLHLQPLTRERFDQWVDMPEAADKPRAENIRARGAVLVSGHIGNWELLLGLRIAYPDFPPAVFLAEEVPYGAINQFLKKLRSHGDILSAFRKGGARPVIKVVADGGIAGLLVDRNVRRQQGGVFAPFLGLEARTTPLPAWIALRHGAAIHPVFCLPQESGRYKIWLGPDLTDELPGGDDRERTRELLTRINHSLETIIRAQPELWNWTLKRFKSRPEVELGEYPAYSLYDPD
jgi:lauroyl/myristoyl acyltransferase